MDTLNRPQVYEALVAKCQEVGFTMPTDVHVGSLLKTLVASKREANVLELGTGIGLSLAWMIEGLDEKSHLVSVDNDAALITIAKEFFGDDPRVELVCEDGTAWLKRYNGARFDLIFADAWPGKYSDIDVALDLLKVGGIYLVDDMQVQPDWPDGHEELASALVDFLAKREDFFMSKLDWSTGVIIMTKRQ